MNRFAFVVAASVAPSEIPLRVYAKELVLAIEQTEGEGFVALTDPAVLLLGAFISFITNAEVTTLTDYRKMLTRCEDRLAGRPTMQ